jgi:spermidine synthase
MPRDRRPRRAAAPQPSTAQVGGGLAELRPDRDRPAARTLLLDGAPQSFVDPDDPRYLGFAYQRRLGHALDLAAPAGRPLRVLHLGGGALTLARYVAATRPRSTQIAVEADTALTEFVRRELPWDRGWRITVRGADARAALERVPEAWADAVLLDVFSGARTPAHLTSVEFVTEVAARLAPGGLYAANLADGGPLTFLRGQVATVRGVFPHACLAADPAVLRGRRFGNAILLAAHHPLPVPALTRLLATDPEPARTLDDPALAAFPAGAAPVTDTTAIPSPPPPPGTFDT